jgi:serpin B
MPTAVASSTPFALRLLDELGPGTVVSPASVHWALTAVREGVSGETRAAMDEVLGPSSPRVEIEGSGVALELAQAIWLDPGHKLMRDLGIECFPLDFEAPDAPARVNRWAADRTSGMIPHLVDEFFADEVFMLTDAVYFDGTWREPFDPAETRPEPFTRPDGSTVEVPMMHLAPFDFQYYEDDDVQAARLFYGDMRELAFVAVIARDGVEPPRIGDWGALVTRKRSGTIAMPRFRAESQLELEEALTAMGLERAFQPGRDFDGLFSGTGEKGLSRVLHRARVEVDEQGTRAAAATGVIGFELSAPGGPRVDLRLDRPFAWAIEHVQTGTILFLGIVTDPREEST